jgi:hypothetical protein
MIRSGLQVGRDEILRWRRITSSDHLLLVTLYAIQRYAHRPFSTQNLNLQTYAVRRVRFDEELYAEVDGIEVKAKAVPSRFRARNGLIAAAAGPIASTHRTPKRDQY